MGMVWRRSKTEKKRRNLISMKRTSINRWLKGKVNKFFTFFSELCYTQPGMSKTSRKCMHYYDFSDGINKIGVPKTYALCPYRLQRSVNYAILFDSTMSVRLVYITVCGKAEPQAQVSLSKYRDYKTC